MGNGRLERTTPGDTWGTRAVTRIRFGSTRFMRHVRSVVRACSVFSSMGWGHTSPRTGAYTVADTRCLFRSGCLVHRMRMLLVQARVPTASYARAVCSGAGGCLPRCGAVPSRAGTCFVARGGRLRAGAYSAICGPI